MSPTEPPFAHTVREVLVHEERVVAAYIYGSQCRGVQTPLSDIDLALVTAGQLSSVERGGLLRRIVLELGRLATGRRLDARLLDELPTAIRGRAVSEGILVFERDPVARVRAEVAARLDYHDYLHFEREGTRTGLAGLRRRLGIG